VVAYWRLDGDGKDVTGAHHGTVVGATPARGRFGDAGGAMAFDGTTRVDVPGTESMTLARGTFEVWVLPTACTGALQTIVSKNANGLWNDVQLYLDGGCRYLLLHDLKDGSPLAVRSSGTAALGRWTHVAGTWDGQVATLWVDGLPQETKPDAYPLEAAGAPIRIGCDSPGNRCFQGRIDEVVVHEVAKSPDYLAKRARPGVPAVRFLAHTRAFADGAGRFPFLDYVLRWGDPAAVAAPAVLTALDKATKCEGLLSPCLGYRAFWRLDDGRGTVAADASTNARHGTIAGGAGWTAGVRGAALAFDGVDDRVSLPAAAMDGLGDFTLECVTSAEGAMAYPTVLSAANATRDNEVVLQSRRAEGLLGVWVAAQEAFLATDLLGAGRHVLALIRQGGTGTVVHGHAHAGAAAFPTSPWSWRTAGSSWASTRTRSGAASSRRSGGRARSSRSGSPAERSSRTRCCTSPSRRRRPGRARPGGSRTRTATAPRTRRTAGRSTRRATRARPRPATGSTTTATGSRTTA
jgi:hypothetical protein